ncbi:MAG: hypothetical protein HC840_08860 [Leptolyngbyaceae cyanobacterium RM2_2_4]|nr:hypothetical protein [Leptolyngbyaceae cyanobacterium RM2_2_4]
MKNLILVLSMIVSTSVYANVGAQAHAERKFRSMSAAEALTSRDFNQEVSEDDEIAEIMAQNPDLSFI